MRPWTETSRSLRLKTFLFRIFLVGYRSETSGKEGKFDVLETKDWVNVVAITTEGEAVMVRQFRFGAAEVTLEFPAGTVEPGELPARTAERELSEETGGRGGRWTALGTSRPNPAFLTNTCHHFAVEGLSLSGPPALDEHEEIERVLVPLAEIDGRIARGEISHALSIVSWHLWKAARG